MVDRSEFVKEFFPDAPERCLRCPALAQAAIRQQVLLNVAGEMTSIALGGEASTDVADPANVIFAQGIDRVAGIVLARRQEQQSLAAHLAQHCPNGPKESRHETRLSRPRRTLVQVTRSCESRAVVADFLLPEVTETVEYPSKG